MAYSYAFASCLNPFLHACFNEMQKPAWKIIQRKQTIRISIIYKRIGCTLLLWDKEGSSILFFSISQGWWIGPFQN